MTDTVVDFDAGYAASLGVVVTDGMFSSADVPGLDIQFYLGNLSGAPSGSTLAYYTEGPGGLTSETGEGELSFVIKSLSGAEFAFKGVQLYEYLGGAFDIRIEGFRDGVSTGFIMAPGVPELYDRTFTTIDLTASKFQYVDEVRITEAGSGSLWLYYDRFVIGEAVSPAPTATNLTQALSFTEDGFAVALGDIVVSDADASEVITATLTLGSAAAGSLSTGTYGSATSTYNAATGVWTVTGSVADVNAALAAVAFYPAANWDQDVTITTRIRDAADTGPADGTITLDATPVNDAPSATNLTQSKAVTEGGSTAALDRIQGDL